MAVMQIKNLAKPYLPKEEKNIRAETGKTDEKNSVLLLFLTEEDKVELSEDKDKDMLKTLLEEAEATAKIELSEAGSSVEDSSGELTKRLVAAIGQFEVRQVISAASKALMKLYAVASSNSKDAALARSYIKKIEKLLSRASRKISDLDKADSLKIQKARAEHQKQRRRAEEIKEELRRREMERRNREQWYLLEELNDKLSGVKGTANPAHPSMKMDAAKEAEISAKAEAMAAAETASSSGNASSGGTASAGSAANSSSSATSSAEAASSGGDASAAAEGGGGEGAE